MVTVALDAMGGDLGLEARIDGAAALSREEADVHVLLVGDVRAMSERLDQIRYDPSRITLVQAEGCVSMDAHPREALTELPACSIARASELVAAGEADAVVSAGNTGATILAAADHFDRLPGIRRAALAAVYPTATRRGPYNDPFALMLDVGATLTAGPEDLMSMALMGAAYSSIVSSIEAPRVALLSNGTEANKGTPEIVAAHELLGGGPLNFAGNVEGLDIPRGTVDVVVCSGFLGNVVLKMLEGVSEVFVDAARKASSRRLQWRIGLAMLQGGLKDIQARTDWKAYGGAPLLGLDKVVIKAHGRSNARAMRNAIKVAAKAVRGDLIGQIRSGMDELQTGGDERAP